MATDLTPGCRVLFSSDGPLVGPRLPSDKLSHVDIHPSHPLFLTVNIDPKMMSSRGSGGPIVDIWNWKTFALIRRVALVVLLEEKRSHLKSLSSSSSAFMPSPLSSSSSPLSSSSGLLSPPSSAPHLSPSFSFSEDDFSPRNIGEIKDVRFYDADVIYWKLHEMYGNDEPRGASSSSSSSASSFTSSPNFQPPARPMIFVLTENRLLFFSQAAEGNIQEIRASSLDKGNFSFTSMEFLYTHPIIALGCSDGCLRLVHLFTRQIVINLFAPAGGHAKSVLRIIAANREHINSPSVQGYPLLISSTADGSIAVWDLDKLVPFVLFQKAHEGSAVLDLHFDPIEGHLVSIAAESVRTAIQWNLSTQRERCRFEQSKKRYKGARTLTQIRLPSSSSSTSSSTFYVFAEKNNRLCVISGDLNQNSFSDLMEIATLRASLLPQSLQQQQQQQMVQQQDQKGPAKGAQGSQPSASDDKTKIYQVRTHPLYQNIVFVASNNGMTVLEFEGDRFPSCCVAACPTSSSASSAFSTPMLDLSSASSPASASLSSSSSPSPENAIFHIASSSPQHQHLPSLNYRSILVQPGEHPMTSKLVRAVPSLSPIGVTGGSNQRLYPQIRSSTSGRYISIVWEHSSTYEIRSVLNESKMIASGRGCDIAWSSSSSSASHETFALLRIDNFQPLASNRFERAPADLRSILSIHSIDRETDAVVDVCKSVDTVAPARQIFGGRYLGVSCHRPGGNASSHGFYFIQWDGAPLSSSIPSASLLPHPRLVVWSSPDQQQQQEPAAVEMSLCAVVLADHLAIFSFESSSESESLMSFKTLCFTREKVQSAVWFASTLFFSTDTQIKCLFVSNQAASAQDTVLLASVDVNSHSPLLTAHGSKHSSLTSSSASASASSSSSSASSASAADMPSASSNNTLPGSYDPIPQPRPRGLLQLIQVMDDVLFVMDSRWRLHRISLAHPCLRFRMLLAAGHLALALSWLPSIPTSQYIKIAEFMEKKGLALPAIHQVLGSSLAPLYPSILLLVLRICARNSLFEEAHTMLTDSKLSASLSSHMTTLFINFGYLAWKQQRPDMAKQFFTLAAAENQNTLATAASRHLIVFLALQGDTASLESFTQRIEAEATSSSSSAASSSAPSYQPFMALDPSHDVLHNFESFLTQASYQQQQPISSNSSPRELWMTAALARYILHQDSLAAKNLEHASACPTPAPSSSSLMGSIALPASALALWRSSSSLSEEDTKQHLNQVLGQWSQSLGIRRPLLSSITLSMPSSGPPRSSTPQHQQQQLQASQPISEPVVVSPIENNIILSAPEAPSAAPSSSSSSSSSSLLVPVRTPTPPSSSASASAVPNAPEEFVAFSPPVSIPEQPVAAPVPAPAVMSPEVSVPLPAASHSASSSFVSSSSFSIPSSSSSSSIHRDAVPAFLQDEDDDSPFAGASSSPSSAASQLQSASASHSNTSSSNNLSHIQRVESDLDLIKQYEQYDNVIIPQQHDADHSSVDADNVVQQAEAPAELLEIL